MGVYFLFCKNMRLYGLNGEKYDDLLRKSANIKGKVEKRQKRGNFHSTYGKKYNFGKKDVERKYPTLGKYTPLQLPMHGFIALIVTFKQNGHGS